MVVAPSVVEAVSTTSPAKLKTTMIIVTPTTGWPGNYDARLEGGDAIIKASRHPLFAWFATRLRPISAPIMQVAA
jgi:hypothetical protein